MPRPAISATLITLNEEKHIARAIDSLRHWVQEIIVVDSGSTDRTREIATNLGARVIVNPFRGYGQQKNFAQDQATYDWILSLDADEAVSPELAAEIERALEKDPNGAIHGYSMPRLSFHLGRWIRHGGWYPNRQIRLAHRRYARWTEPKVHEAWKINGAVQPLAHDLLHWPFEDLADQIATNVRYSRQGYEALLAQGAKSSLAKLVWKPISKFLETYVWKKGFLDGMPGFLISVNAAHSVFMKFSYYYEKEK